MEGVDDEGMEMWDDVVVWLCRESEICWVEIFVLEQLDGGVGGVAGAAWQGS